MNDTILLAGVGFIIGAFASSAVWLVVWAVGRAQRQVARERNLIMKAIGEESAEAEKVLSSGVAKSMNAHALRSALSPRIEKMQKTLIANMHQLDTFFVKYMESRIAAYRAAFASGQAAPAGYAGGLPPAASRVESESQAAILDEIQSRMDSSAPAAPPPVPAPVRARSFEGPAVEPGTGVITVSEEVREERGGPSPVPLEPARPEPAFDLENIMGKTPQRMPAKAPGAFREDNRIEQTIRWDRDQLMKAAAPSGEAVVVDGSEVLGKAQPPRTPVQPEPAADKQNPIISGEDIENTLDSFFGLGKQ